MHFLLKFKLKVLLGSLLPWIPTTTALDPYQLLPQLWKELPWLFALLPCTEAPLNGPGEGGEWAPSSSLCDGEPVGVLANSRIASAHFLFASSATPCLWLSPSFQPLLPFQPAFPLGLHSGSTHSHQPFGLMSQFGNCWLWPARLQTPWGLTAVETIHALCLHELCILFLPTQQRRRPGHQVPQRCSRLHITTVCCS